MTPVQGRKEVEKPRLMINVLIRPMNVTYGSIRAMSGIRIFAVPLLPLLPIVIVPQILRFRHNRHINVFVKPSSV